MSSRNKSWEMVSLNSTNAAYLSSNLADGTSTESIPSTKTEDASTCRPQPQLKTCVCHPVFYGSIQTPQLVTWMDYYRALGIDHFFYWKTTELSQVESFQKFEQTVSAYATGEVMPDEKMKIKMGQLEAETRCLTKAKELGYQWALFIDADEFLWFEKNQTLKEFLHDHEENSFISFGKWMYSMESVLQGDTSNIGSWGLSNHPFTAGPYCYRKPQKAKVCPTWLGRCKIILQPEKNSIPKVHGDGKRGPGWTHINTDLAHLKEWRGIATTNVTVVERPPEDFNTKDFDTLFFHASHAKNSDGTGLIHYDRELKYWLEFLNSRKHCA